MNYFFLALVVVGVALQQICQKAYNIKVGGGIYSFTAGGALAALLVFVITAEGKFEFVPGIFTYAVVFAAFYSATIAGSVCALKTGPLSLTSLFVSYSLIIPALYGLVALGEPASLLMGAGIVFLLVSLFLINFTGKKDNKKVSLKWGFFVFLAFAGNGMCSTVQKIQQISFEGKYKSELMITAYAITAVAMFALALIAEKKQAFISLKKGFGFYSVCGVTNGVVNFLVLVLSGVMAASEMFPVISAGGVVAAALVSIFIYKEKLKAQQWAGMALGIVAIVVLSV